MSLAAKGLLPRPTSICSAGVETALLPGDASGSRFGRITGHNMRSSGRRALLQLRLGTR